MAEQDFDAARSAEEEIQRDRNARRQAQRETSRPQQGQRAPTREQIEASYTPENLAFGARSRKGRKLGLSGGLLEEYIRQSEIAAGDAPDSAAVEDIRAMGSGLQAQARGAGARGRDPFAAARNILSQRAAGEILSAQEREIAQQRFAEQAQAREILKQIELGAEIRQQQERLAEAQREDFLSQGIGGLLGGGLGALGVYLGGGGPLAAYQMAIGGGGTAGSQLARFISDERMKTDVRDGNKEIQEMLDAIAPKTYNKSGKKETGVMAQDLEKSSAGSEMVEEVEGVKTVGPDFNKVLAALVS